MDELNRGTVIAAVNCDNRKHLRLTGKSLHAASFPVESGRIQVVSR